MLPKSFMYIKNYKRIIVLLAFLLLYISMYLIHNAYGPLSVIKGNSSSGVEVDIDDDVVAKQQLDKAASHSNLFAVSRNVVCIEFSARWLACGRGRSISVYLSTSIEVEEKESRVE